MPLAISQAPIQTVRRVAAGLLLAILAVSCHPNDPSKVFNQVTNNQEEAPGYYPWASRSIEVCFVNPEAAKSYLDSIKSALTTEYSKVGFDLYRGWGQCPPDNHNAAQSDRSKALLKIKFATDVPTQFGASSPVGSLYGRLAEITLRSDPKTYSDDYCHQDPMTCMQRWAVHETGHTFGLAHSHQHPMNQQEGNSPYAMPLHISNSDSAFRNVNFIGDFASQSIMSFDTPLSVVALQDVDIRTLHAIYDQPTVVLRGPSSYRTGRWMNSLSIKVTATRFPDSLDYSVSLPTHYRYKISPVSESCNSAEGYSSPISLDQEIKERLLDKFPLGTPVKLCVVGSNESSEQDFASHTNLMWLVGPDPTKNYNFEGLVHNDNCSGSLVRFAGTRSHDKVMVLTNGHCIGLAPGQSVVDGTIDMRFFPLANDGVSPTIGLYDESQYFQATKILYATLGGTDIALLETNRTYESLDGKKTLIISKASPRVGQEVDVLSGLYSEGYSCKIDFIAKELREDSASFFDPMRYGPGCKLFPGTSGSPMVDSTTGLLVGINSTGNDQGEQCTQNNPCEVDEKGQISYKKGYGYAMQTQVIYGCLRDDRILDLGLPGCRLPHP